MTPCLAGGIACCPPCLEESRRIDIIIHAVQFPRSASYVRYARLLIYLQLPVSFSKQELDRAEVLLVHRDVLLEFPSSKSVKVWPGVGRLGAGGTQAAAVEAQDISLEAGEAGHARVK